MMLLTIPLRYARVKWLRTLLLVAVFALGVASMTGLYQVSTLIGDSFEKKLISYGANILVTPKRDTLKVSYGGYTLGDVALEEHWINLTQAHTAIDAMPLRANVAVVAPKLLSTTRLEGQSIALVGVSWPEELALKAYWEVSGELPAQDSTNSILAGANIAKKFNLLHGQSLKLGGQDMQISGVLQATGSDDDNVIFAPLAFVQKLAGKPDMAAFLEVAALCSGCPIEDIVMQLQQALPNTEVIALRQVAESRMYAVHFAQNLAFYVSLVILVTACAMIIMSMLSAVAERRKEIGIMRAVGFSRSSVFVVFVTEALVIGLLSGIAGYIIGHMLAGYVLGQLHLTDTTSLSFNFTTFAATIAIVSLTAGVAAAFPAWKASLVEPAEALVAL